MHSFPDVASARSVEEQIRLLDAQNHAAFLSLSAKLDALRLHAAEPPQESWLSWGGKLLVSCSIAWCAGTGFGNLVGPLIRDLHLWLR